LQILNSNLPIFPGRAGHEYWHTIHRRCSKGVDLVLDCYPKLVAIDEVVNHEIVHGHRLGKAERATYKPFNPRLQIDVFALDFL
jgi:hypothetical protein